MGSMALKQGWLRRDTKRAALRVAQSRVEEAEQRVRVANDELAEAATALRVARKNLRSLKITA